jgi:hypothetical protein
MLYAVRQGLRSSDGIGAMTILFGILAVLMAVRDSGKSNPIQVGSESAVIMRKQHR